MPATPPPDRLIVRAPAKVNLCLHVGQKRADGFHDLESLVAFTGGDVLRFERADELSLSIEGVFADGLTGAEDNLVLKAARLLSQRENVNLGAHIALQKDLPVSSGLGGGSADAAATLRGLVRLWDLDLALPELHSIAAQLGSDVPVCLMSQPAWIEGRGEKIALVPEFPHCWFLLINPGVPVSTAEVFRRLKMRTGVGARRLNGPFWNLASMTGYLESTTNDLETPAREIAPEIGVVLDELRRQPGALLSRMSGSGATCFGIFANEELAWNAAQSIVSRHDDWWVASTPLAESDEGEPRLLEED